MDRGVEGTHREQVGAAGYNTSKRKKQSGFALESSEGSPPKFARASKELKTLKRKLRKEICLSVRLNILEGAT